LSRPQDADLHWCEQLVATAIDTHLAMNRRPPLGIADRLTTSLRHTDFGGLGLDSLDWMAIATRLEAATGVQLEDAVMLDRDRRSIAGWALALWRGGAGRLRRKQVEHG
jgi:hypothetical protein